MTIGGIVLAGGASTRFGRDKLAEPIDGVTLLERAITAVRAVADDVVVVLAPGDDRALPPGVRSVNDASAFAGPLVGLGTGLAALPDTVDGVVVVGGDMPSLEPDVLRALLAALDGVGLACLHDRDGRARPLPMAIRRDPGVKAVDALVGSGERRLRAMLDHMPSVVIPFDRWSVADADGATLVDIDTAADLQAR
jgi:molybdenum cofactor guanylyltransferase